MSTTEMEYNYLGKCGTQVSALSLGGWTTYGGSVKEQERVDKIITTAFDRGINFFDIADVYSKGAAEKAMGKIFKKFKRSELVISSKVYFPFSDDVNDQGLGRKHIMESIEKSLKRIGTDYLDIYFCHRFDENSPTQETVRAMDDLVRQGKILYWGTSEWTGSQLREAHEIGEHYRAYSPQVEQPQYSLLAREKYETDVQPSLEELGMGAVVWSPLASGVLTGKYDEGVPESSRLDRIDWLRDRMLVEETIERVKKFKEYAEELNCTRAQLALAWAMSQKGVSSVITGATKVDQLEENLGALKVEIPSEMAEKIDALFPCEASNGNS